MCAALERTQTIGACGHMHIRAGGPDVYKGGHFIDYRGDDVNAANVLAVLEGNRSAVKGIGTGKVRGCCAGCLRM